ncbi:RNA polymerase subunit sigma-70 [Stackebrandtia nassauensis]
MRHRRKRRHMATATREDEFARRAEPLRPELLGFCYRMLGSVHEAEDVLQDALLRAWRAFPRFEDRSSLRTWLYRITTNACLRALERAKRRPLPSGWGDASADPEAPVPSQTSDVPWLQPFPDDPASVVEGRESMRLALVAALQLLPPRRRVVLILRDVLEWRAGEVAEFLDTTPAAVNSLLQHARSQLRRANPKAVREVGPLTARQREFVDRYAKAFAEADLDALTAALSADAVWEMPPYPTWFAGRDHVVRFLATKLGDGGGRRFVRVSANGQPALALYLRDGDGFAAYAVHVLDVGEAGVEHVVAFMDPGLFAGFGLPPRIAADDARDA